jgi:hypothetical protein
MTAGALKGSRIRHMNVPSLIATFADGDGWGVNSDWQEIVDGTATGVYHEGYFDLSGYELDDLTLVPSMVTLQDGLPYYSSNLADPLLAIAVFDIVSQERLTPSDVSAYYLASLDFPGSPGSTEDWSQVMMCNYRLFVPQADFVSATLLLPATAGSFGSNEPSAVQKLWTYRIVITGGLDWSAQTISIPATRFVLGAEIIEEKDLPYLMRLKRSYELSTQG